MMSEMDLYEPVRRWLGRRLKAKYSMMDVQVFDSHSKRLSRIVSDLGLQSVFPQSNAWDVKVDVTGVVSDGKHGHIALVECKAKQLTLRDIGQLLGYSIVVDPVLSILVSPSLPTDPLLTLLRDYGRLDVLQYGPQKRYIRLARWHTGRSELMPSSIIPPGRLV